MYHCNNKILSKNYSKNQPLISNWHSPEKLSTLITFLRRVRNFQKTFERSSARARGRSSARTLRQGCHLQIQNSVERSEKPNSKISFIFAAVHLRRLQWKPCATQIPSVGSYNVRFRCCVLVWTLSVLFALTGLCFVVFQRDIFTRLIVKYLRLSLSLRLIVMPHLYIPTNLTS